MKDGKIITNLTKHEAGSQDLEDLFFQLTEDNKANQVEEVDIKLDIEIEGEVNE